MMPAFTKQLKLLTAILIILHPMQIAACSMCKITTEGKTLVGNNEDYWSIEAKIWFVNGLEKEFGVAYVGHKNNFPQGALNTQGLVFDGFSLYAKNLGTGKGKKAVKNKRALLEHIMKNCSNVHEVGNFLKEYNLSVFSNGMYWFIDKTGEHLIVETDTLIYGIQSYYALTNFRPSETEQLSDVNIPKFQKALTMLQDKTKPDLAFMEAVMDTMKTCTKPLGDGTLYTTIYDLAQTDIYLYFYHNFDQNIKLNLQEELSKGDHTIAIPELFKDNQEYARFLAYKTPINNNWIRHLLIAIFGSTVLISGYFLFVFIRRLISRKKQLLHLTSSMLFLLINLMVLILTGFYLISEMVYYVGIEQSLLSFPFPIIKHFPLLIAFLTLTMLGLYFRVFKAADLSKSYKFVSALNLFIYLTFNILNVYWNSLIL
jgi:hypothetical protein